MAALLKHATSSAAIPFLHDLVVESLDPVLRDLAHRPGSLVQEGRIGAVQVTGGGREEDAGGAKVARSVATVQEDGSRLGVRTGESRAGDGSRARIGGRGAEAGRRASQVEGRAGGSG